MMENDLRLCSVRQVNDSERRYCFEVLSPNKYAPILCRSTDVIKAFLQESHPSS